LHLCKTPINDNYRTKNWLLAAVMDITFLQPTEPISREPAK
jgi:hypothetical protein